MIELEVIPVDAAEILGHLQLIAVRVAEAIEPGLLVEADRFHTEAVRSSTQPARRAHPQRDPDRSGARGRRCLDTRASSGRTRRSSSVCFGVWITSNGYGWK
mgnify:CR=1 FL=1